LIEAIVCAFIAGIIELSLLKMYVQVHQMGNMSQAQLAAGAIAQEIVDNLRAQPFTVITSNLGTHNPQVNGPGLGSATDVLFPRPLLKDDGLDYAGHGDATVAQGLSNLFTAVDPVTRAHTNSITVELQQPGGGITPVAVTVTIGYIDTLGAPRSYVSHAIISATGLNG
jgi:hypothetical protein